MHLRRLSAVLVVPLVLLTFASRAGANPPTPPPDPVRVWNELALATVRSQSASDAQAARLLAMVNVAVYDAVNGIVSKQTFFSRRAHALVPPDGAPFLGNVYARASRADPARAPGSPRCARRAVPDARARLRPAARGRPRGPALRRADRGGPAVGSR